jgi:uncharacterized membrane protein
LNLVLNVICAVQAPIIMMSQNRQSVKDRLAADIDYQLNLKLEIQLQDLHRKVDELIKQSASSASASPFPLSDEEPRLDSLKGARSA